MPAALAVAVAAVAGMDLAGSAGAQSVPGITSTAPSTTPSLVSRGAQLYAEQCSTCHQSDGEGQAAQGIPSLRGVGAAEVDFYLSTGRMPEATLARQAPRKPVSLSRADRDALIAYVTTQWPGGPAIPTFDLDHGDLATGGNLFRTNCAACHGAVGAGAALAYGVYAPSLRRATPRQIAEAMRIGPGNMPVFGPSALSDAQVADIVTYVRYLDHPNDRGGAGLGHTGPIAEGFVGLLFGLATLVGVAAWVGHRRDDEVKERDG